MGEIDKGRRSDSLSQQSIAELELKLSPSPDSECAHVLCQRVKQSADRAGSCPCGLCCNRSTELGHWAGGERAGVEIGEAPLKRPSPVQTSFFTSRTQCSFSLEKVFGSEDPSSSG